MTIQILASQTEKEQLRTPVLAVADTPTDGPQAWLTSDRADEIVAGWLEDPIDRWRKEHKRRDRVWHKPAPTPPHLALAAGAVERVAARLEALGYTVEPTTGNASWDLEVEDCLRVEVKAATWRKQKPDKDHRKESRGRYQANIRARQAGQADLFIFVAINGTDHHFIIPVADLRGRHSLTIRTYNPSFYTGCLAEFREAWQLVGPALTAARERAYQGRLEL